MLSRPVAAPLVALASTLLTLGAGCAHTPPKGSRVATPTERSEAAAFRCIMNSKLLGPRFAVLSGTPPRLLSPYHGEELAVVENHWTGAGVDHFFSWTTTGAITSGDQWTVATDHKTATNESWFGETEKEVLKVVTFPDGVTQPVTAPNFRRLECVEEKVANQALAAGRDLLGLVAVTGAARVATAPASAARYVAASCEGDAGIPAWFPSVAYIEKDALYLQFSMFDQSVVYRTALLPPPVAESQNAAHFQVGSTDYAALIAKDNLGVAVRRQGSEAALARCTFTTGHAPN